MKNCQDYIKNNLSIGILSWKREDILLQTLNSYKKAGLLDMSSDITIYFNEINDKDIAIAKKFKLNYLGTKDNIGIKNAIKELTEHAKNKYFLFLENDWYLIEKKNVIEQLLYDSITILNKKEADVVKLRSTKKPGEPCHTETLRNNPYLVEKKCLDNLLIIHDHPSDLYPELIKEKHQGKNNFFILDSKNAQYTNNPCLYINDFLKKLVSNHYDKNTKLDMSEYAKLKNTSLNNISLEADIIPYWENAHFKVARSTGLFTHKDYTLLDCLKSIKIIRKEKLPNGRRHIYFCGIKIFSYKRQNKYDKIFAKRFKGLSEKEARFVIETQFERMTGYKLNLDNPQTFNEKIQWLKLYYKDPLMTKCADKVKVRDYIKEKIGEEYLVPCLGIYDSPDEINFEKLPEKFVMKVNWGSGQNIIVTDKSKLNIKEAKEKLRNWMKLENNHYYDFLEWVYKDIEPKIIIEQYIDVLDDLIDYKFMCYNGEPRNMFLVQNRSLKKDMNVTFYDMDFNILPFNRLYKRTKNKAEKPKLWNEMVELSKILSEPFPFVRVDWYVYNNQLKLGELTFYPGNGTEIFDPIEWDYKFGEDICIENLEKKYK